MRFPVETLADGLGHPEGPDVLPDGRIVMVETYASRIAAWSAERGVHTYADCGGGPNACMLGTDGLYITQNGGTVGRWRAERMTIPSIQKATPDGRVEIAVSEVDGIPLQAPNDLSFGPDGRLYFTDPADYLPDDRKPGRVFVVGPDGTGELLEELPDAYPNGIVVEPDGSVVWVESYERRVYRRRPGGRSELIHQLPEGHVPDGLKIAANGDLWITTFMSGGVDIIAPDGTPIDFLETGGVPLNCVFAGTDLLITDFGGSQGGPADSADDGPALADPGRRGRHAGVPRLDRLIDLPHVIHGTDRRTLVEGRSLFDYADEVSATVPTSCQRTGRCRECVVEIMGGADALSARTEPERYLPARFRLACQCRIAAVDEDVEFSILRRRLRIVGPTEGAAVHTDIDPVVTVRNGLVHYGTVPVDRLRRHVLGLAVDIGTTTIAFQLIEPRTSEIVAGAAMENPQRFGGSDVMNRISYERDHPGDLRNALRRPLNHELKRLYQEHGIQREEVYEVVIAANTTMRDMFFGIDVSPIGESPYKSLVELAWREGKLKTTSVVRLAHEVGLLVGPRARVLSAPLIASHVGADTAADLVAVDFGAAPGIRCWSTSGRTRRSSSLTARGSRGIVPGGPGVRGRLVRYGMPGADGAIESVQHRR